MAFRPFEIFPDTTLSGKICKSWEFPDPLEQTNLYWLIPSDVTHFCLPHLLPLLKFTVKWLPECFQFFEAKLRSKFPYGSYKQVFVDESYNEFSSYASLSILNTNLLQSSAVIDQVNCQYTVSARIQSSSYFTIQLLHSYVVTLFLTPQKSNKYCS